MCGIGDTWVKDHGEEGLAVPNTADDAPEGALIIFVKNPEKGKVKTRLAATIGDDKALEAYMYMLAHTREVTILSRGTNFLYYSQFVDENDAWPSAHFRKNVQIAGDLGEKMKHAFSEVFATGQSKAVIIGSDCLDLRATHLNKALKALDHYDFVIGPANDGGYYLIGMREFQPSIFDNMVWSTETVLTDTLRNIEALKGTTLLLEELSDVDYEEDLIRAMKNHKKT